jgi:hypothetical protein
MKKFDVKKPDLSTQDGGSALIALVWCVVACLGVLTAETIIGGVAGVLLSAFALILAVILAYITGLYTAGWRPGQDDDIR